MLSAPSRQLEADAMIQNMRDNQADFDNDDPIELEEKYHNIDSMTSMECIDLAMKHLEGVIIEKYQTDQLFE